MELMRGINAEDVRRFIVLRFSLNDKSVVVFIVVRIPPSVSFVNRVFDAKDDATTTADNGMVESVQMDFTGNTAVAAAHSLEALPVADSELTGLSIVKVTDGVVLAAPEEDSEDDSDKGNTTITIVIICAVALLLVLIGAVMVYCCYRRARGDIVSASSVYGVEESTQAFFEVDGMHHGGGGGTSSFKNSHGDDYHDAELDDLDMGVLAENNDVDINLRDTESDGHLL